MNGFLVLFIYAFIMIATTVIFTKWTANAERFHVADRKIPFGISAMSIAATWVWAPALFVSGQQAYQNGIPGMFWFLVPNVLCLMLFIPFAKRIRNEFPQGITLSGYMGEKYQSNKVKGIYSFQLGTLAILSTAVQLLAGSKILSLITGLPFWVMTMLLAVIAYSYSQFSGIKAAVATDTLQMIIILGGCILLVPWALKMNGGASALIQGLGSINGNMTSLTSQTGLAVFLGFGLPTAIGLTSGPFGDQCFWQRVFSIRKEHIGKAFFVGALIFALVPIAMGAMGFIAAGSGFKASDVGMVNFEFISSIFPAWVLIPFLFMILSGLLSTVSSNLCAAASMTSDLKTGSSIKKSKLTMLMLLVVAIAISNIPGLTVTWLFLFYGTLRASTLLPTVMTLLGKKLSARGVFIGVLISLCLGLPIFAYGNIFNIALYKTIGSLTTVLMSGIVAVLASRKAVRA
ncbi:MAG: hypothetical protein K0R50_411 [Eubacterium sp.]|jgi:Na+/proline symporter|nr:hypothetical protein [Eubacterium sp.]